MHDATGLAPPVPRTGPRAVLDQHQVLTEAAGLLAGLEPTVAVQALLGLVVATSGADRAWLALVPGLTDEATAALAAECDDALSCAADALHDGPSQEAVAARMTAALLERRTESEPVVSESIADLSRSLRTVTAAQWAVSAPSVTAST